MSRPKQKEAILTLLRRYRGAWCPLPEIITAQGAGTIIGQYNARIYELKHEDGYDIENKTEMVDGQKKSWYRINEPRQMRIF